MKRLDFSKDQLVIMLHVVITFLISKEIISNTFTKPVQITTTMPLTLSASISNIKNSANMKCVSYFKKLLLSVGQPGVKTT